MGCTSSSQSGSGKAVTGLAPATLAADDGQQLVNDQFRKWLKTNRPQADEYVLHDVLSTAQPANEEEDYKTIVSKALDLLADRQDIKSTNKLGKLVQKEVTLASPKKVAHTINVLKQTADKLRTGNIQLDSEQISAADELASGTPATQHHDAQLPPGEPGIPLKEALERARVLFYKGKQAAIFANPHGGYDVRILDENDETINHDGNLLRSIIVTEVKLRPRAPPPTTTTAAAPPPPPPAAHPPPKLLDENDISDDFRRSIDDALKGLEAVYQTPSPPLTTISENVNEPPSPEKPVPKSTSSTPLFVQYGVTNAPLPRSASKERTGAAPAPPVDRTVHLAEIIRQMAEQQKVVSERLAAEERDDMPELVMDVVDVVTCSELEPPAPTDEAPVESEGPIERMVKEMKEHGEKFESKESLSTLTTTAKQPSSYSLGLTSPLAGGEPAPTSPPHPKAKLRSENRPKSFMATEETASKDRYDFIKQMSLDELAHLTQTGLSNPNLTTSVTKLGISTSSGKIEEEAAPAAATLPASISQIIEEHGTILDESATTATPPPTVVTPVEPETRMKSPSHNVTYTEIIHSESRDGEQSRRFVTESYDEHPSTEDEQTTTLKVITKSEFSNHPTTGEKIMEQSVQVITVKVRNETIKTTIQQASVPSAAEHESSYERRPVSELVKNFEVVTGNGANT